MTDSATMFEPLSAEELATGPTANASKTAKGSIVPVPEDAPQMRYRHRRHGEPNLTWQYQDAQARLVGYICRWDLTNTESKRDKGILPITFCDLGDGRRDWVAKGFPEPRPLYRLPELVKRSDAPVLVVEGEKAADAAAKLFPELVVTTPPHGAKSPHKADWAPVKGHPVSAWGDNDDPGSQFAATVARLSMDSGATSVAIVKVPPDFPEGWDLADEPPAGWTTERLRKLLDTARPVEPNQGDRVPPRRDWAFRLRPEGVSKRHEDKEGNVEWRPVCSPLEVIAETRNEHGEDWGRLLVAIDRDGNQHEWAMPMEMLAGSGEEYRRRLLSMGLRISPGTVARNALHEYVSEAQPEAKARCVSRVGWHQTASGNVFILPGGCYGTTNGERVLLQSATSNAHNFQMVGSLEEWQDGIARYCVGNSRLALAVSTAFAGPLLYLTNEPSGGIHFVGRSQNGKTTVVRAGGSVWGGGSLNGFLRTWRATSNGLEGTAAELCDTLLCLDEIGQRVHGGFRLGTRGLFSSTG